MHSTMIFPDDKRIGKLNEIRGEIVKAKEKIQFGTISTKPETQP